MKNLYLGLNFLSSSHNYSLSVLYDEKIYAIEFERITRIKNYPGLLNDKDGLNIILFDKLDHDNVVDKDVILLRKYLSSIITAGLLKLGINLKIIDNIYTINFPFGVSVEGYNKKVKGYKKNYHHLFHACSTYYPSQFDEAVILCMDHNGYDEELGGITPMHSIWHAKGNKINFLYSDNFSSVKGNAGIGAVFEAHSYMLGIGEGTLMGLSGYGKSYFDNINLFEYKSGGVFLSKNLLSKNSFDGDYDFIKNIYLGFKKVYNLEGEVNQNNIEKSIYADIAYKVQKDSEEAILYLANKAYNLTGCKNICIAGGVGLNILANTLILKQAPFKNIFIQPACNDTGLSLGGLYYMYHNLLGYDNRIRLTSPGLGINYSGNEILNILNKYSNKISYKKLGSDKYNRVSKLLKDNKIVGWFHGRSEFGPRALGFRSILASPISKSMKNKVNNIKDREQYRPLAPVFLEDFYKDYLDTKEVSPYMTLSADVFKDKRKIIPSVVHIDGTSRYQTVNKSQNKELYYLLNEFNKETGVPVLINTSFNQHNEPIVETPEDAIKMFMSTDLDYLCIGDFLVSKENKYLEYKYDEKNSIKEYNNILDTFDNEKILIELILTNQCNKRCDYCDLDFKNKSLSFSELDLFITFLKNNKADYTINFFGGEPLLTFDKLKYFLDNSKNYVSKYSIGTNGVLLDKEKLEYFLNNNVNIYLSIDNISVGKDLDLELLSKYSKIINVNFINNPDFLFNSIITYEKIKEKGFKNIAFMPVFSTKKWSKKAFLELKKIYEYIKKYSSGIKLESYTYFNGVAIDKQFILDTDLNFYSDLDSLLWLQKQYKNIDIELKKEINKKTKLLSLNAENMNLNNLINLYNIEEVLKLIFEIPKKAGNLLEYKVIDKILKNGAEKR